MRPGQREAALPQHHEAPRGPSERGLWAWTPGREAIRANALVQAPWPAPPLSAQVPLSPRD